MSIRWKITLLLGLLAVLMLLKSLDGILHLDRSAHTFEALSQRVEKTLNDIETLARATDQLEELTVQIAQATEPDELRDHERSLDTILTETRKAAQTVGQVEAPSFEVGGRLETVATAAAETIQERGRVLQLRSRYAALREDLYESAQQLRSYLLPFRVRLLSDVTAGGTATAADDLRLLFSLTALIGRIDDLLATEELDQTATIEADISRLISGGVSGLAGAQSFPERTGLIDALARVHEIVLGTNGLEVAANELRVALQDEVAAASALRGAMFEISREIATLVRRSEQEVGRIYAEAATRAQQRFWSEIVVNAVVGFGFVAAVWVVFVHQISARLEKLTRSVLRLASGDLSPFDIPNGRDEFGRMTQALEVFRQNARELRRSNEDLANFAYAASHDLRTPLRAIRDLVDWTVEDRSETLHPEVRRNLTLIRTRADRLSRLLQDLLDYARAGRNCAEIVPIDVSAMVRDVAELVGDAEALRLEFRGEPLVETEVVPLHTILLNLVSNAVKHHDGDRVNVLVTVSWIGDGWDVSIADDGPGIPLRYQGQVFDLFKTLKSRDSVEGSGLGLAMVEKLAKHLEGSITLVSNPEKERGTTFILNIPAPSTPHRKQAETKGVAA